MGPKGAGAVLLVLDIGAASGPAKNPHTCHILWSGERYATEHCGCKHADLVSAGPAVLPISIVCIWKCPLATDTLQMAGTALQWEEGQRSVLGPKPLPDTEGMTLESEAGNPLVELNPGGAAEQLSHFQHIRRFLEDLHSFYGLAPALCCRCLVLQSSFCSVSLNQDQPAVHSKLQSSNSTHRSRDHCIFLIEGCELYDTL